MKLYCVKIQYKNQEGIDVQHMLGNEPKDIHIRMEKFRSECEKYNYPIDHFSFHEVQQVDGFSKLNEFLSRYYIEGNKIKSV